MKNTPDTPREPNGLPARLHSRAHKVLLEMTAPPRPVIQPSKKVREAMRKKGIIMTNVQLGELPEKKALEWIKKAGRTMNRALK